MNYSIQKNLHLLKVRGGSELPGHRAAGIPNARPAQAHILQSPRSLQGRGMSHLSRSLAVSTRPSSLPPLMDPGPGKGLMGNSRDSPRLRRRSLPLFSRLMPPGFRTGPGDTALQDRIRLSSPCGRLSTLALDVPARTFSSRK